jgi:hypothetical protein
MRDARLAQLARPSFPGEHGGMGGKTGMPVALGIQDVQTQLHPAATGSHPLNGILRSRAMIAARLRSSCPGVGAAGVLKAASRPADYTSVVCFRAGSLKCGP